MDGKNVSKKCSNGLPKWTRMDQEFAKRLFWGAPGAGVGQLAEKYPKSDSPNPPKWWFRLSGNTVFTFPPGCKKPPKWYPKATLFGAACSNVGAKAVPERHKKKRMQNRLPKARKHTPNRLPKLIGNVQFGLLLGSLLRT